MYPPHPTAAPRGKSMRPAPPAGTARATLPDVLAVTHTLASAAIGTAVPNAPAAFGIAFVVHLLSDALLHWNIYPGKHRPLVLWVVLDVLGGLFLVYWLAPERFFTAPVLAAILGGNLPDIHAGVWTVLNLPKDRFLRFHSRIQRETEHPARGLVWQGVLIALSLWILRT